MKQLTKQLTKQIVISEILDKISEKQESITDVKFQNIIYYMDNRIRKVSQKQNVQISPKKTVYKMQLEITGIVITPDSKMAVIWDNQHQQSHILFEKDHLNEWQVTSIDSAKVTLGNTSGDSYDFLLNEEAETNSNAQR